MDLDFNLGLDTFRNFGSLGDQMGANFAGQQFKSKYVCKVCLSTEFSSSDGGATMVCKSCGNVLSDHVENVEEEFD